MALEPTMILLGLPIGMTWTDIRRALRRPDFITSVLQFDSSSVTDEMRAVITDRYASNPGFTYEVFVLMPHARLSLTMLRLSIVQALHADR